MCQRGHLHHNVGSRSNWLLCSCILVITLLVGGLGACEALKIGEKETLTVVEKGEHTTTKTNNQNTISDVSSRLLPDNDMDDNPLLSMASYLPTIFEDETYSPTSQPSFVPTTNNSDAPTFADLPSNSPTLHPSPEPTTSGSTTTASPTIAADSSGCKNYPLLGGVRGADFSPGVGTMLMTLLLVIWYY